MEDRYLIFLRQDRLLNWNFLHYLNNTWCILFQIYVLIFARHRPVISILHCFYILASNMYIYCSIGRKAFSFVWYCMEPTWKWSNSRKCSRHTRNSRLYIFYETYIFPARTYNRILYFILATVATPLIARYHAHEKALEIFSNLLSAPASVKRATEIIS